MISGYPDVINMRSGFLVEQNLVGAGGLSACLWQLVRLVSFWR